MAEPDISELIDVRRLQGRIAARRDAYELQQQDGDPAALAQERLRQAKDEGSFEKVRHWRLVWAVLARRATLGNPTANPAVWDGWELNLAFAAIADQTKRDLILALAYDLAELEDRSNSAAL